MNPYLNRNCGDQMHSRMSIVTYFLLAVAFACFISANGDEAAVDFTTCPETNLWKGSIESLQVEDCPDPHKPCILVKGHNTSITLQFKPTEQIQAVKALVKAIVAGIAVDFQIPQSNACENSGLQCPLMPGQLVTYQAVLVVKKIYPSIHFKVRWALVDDQNRTIVCVLIPAHVVNKAPAHH